MPTAVSASSSNNSNNSNTDKASVATEGNATNKNERMRAALKRHILRERQRKRQEREAEVAEERQRKEREARERQDVMTLGETREQITELEHRLAQLKEEKHQLFRQLKKVLHEDDSRRRQLGKENNEMLSGVQVIPSGGLVHPQLFLTPSGPAAPPFKVTGAKRARTPSPPMATSLYPQQSYAYKPQAVVNTPYQPPQKEDSRRGHEFVRAVLWNKPSQYASQPTAGGFYPVPGPEQRVVYYQQAQPTGPAPPPVSAPPPSRPLYEPTYGMRPPAATHVTLHGGPAIPITPAQPAQKTGSITSGYPVRSQSQYQPPPAGLYQTQARPLYSTPGAPMNYPPPRE